MKLLFGIISEYGNFSIEPTEGQEILAIFIDCETKLLIVQERPTCVTTIDAAAGRILPPEERKLWIDYSEKTETDHELGMRRVFRRELNTETGDEQVHEQLYASDSDSDSDALISRSSSIAFSASKIPTIFDSHRRRVAMQESQDAFWRTEYAVKTFEERVAYWSAQIHRAMRSQSESGLDEYAGFTPAWYEHARRREPAFDEVLTFLFERHRDELLHQGCSSVELLRRIGKSELAKPARRKQKRKNSGR